MMIDIDGEDNVRESLVKLQNYCSKHSDYLFFIYESRNGIHIFCMSHEKDYTNLNHIKFMLDMKCDFFYSLYAHIRGWCVRLNKKENEYVHEEKDDNSTIHKKRMRIKKNKNSAAVSKFIYAIGPGKSKRRLIRLMRIYHEYLDKYKNEPPCNMP